MANPLKDAGIEHVVVLMLENRGFDHVLGWLYEKTDKPNIISKSSDTRGFIGLSTVDNINSLANINPFDPKTPIPPIKGCRSPAIPEFNPGEHFVHIMTQMWGGSPGGEQNNWQDPAMRANFTYSQYKKFDNPPMNGYVMDFKDEISHAVDAKSATQSNAVQIIETYLPEQLPVLNGLAKHYAVSDEWFCSVPSQTNTNRAFSTAGTSRGLVTNNYYDMAKQPGIDAARLKPFTALAGLSAKWRDISSSKFDSHADRLPETTRSIFGLLSTFKKDWKVFWQSTWPPSATIPQKASTSLLKVQYVRGMFPELDDKCYEDNFVPIDPIDPNNKLFQSARSGSLPAVSWIEPKWGGGASMASSVRLVGTDMHPACDTTVAEDFVNNLYQALSASTKWEKTLFVITFDENGGTYDHVPPFGSQPRASKPTPIPQDWQPKPSDLDRTPPPGPCGGTKDMDVDTRTEFGFQFDQFGIRVPTLLISPKIPPNTIFRSNTDVPFDHTSLIATILDWQEIDRKYWLFGSRTAQAPTFAHVLNQSEQGQKEKDFNQSIKRTATVGANIFTNTEYRLKYLGNPWGTALNPGIYLAAPEWSGKSQGYYPALTNKTSEAIKIKINGSGTKVHNMATVKLSFVEPPRYLARDLPDIAVTSTNKYAFCAVHGSNLYNTKWQIRLMGSRSPLDPIRIGDWFCFISTGYTALDNTKFDPYQRLCPTDDLKYLTTKAGIWGAWTLEPVS